MMKDTLLLPGWLKKKETYGKYSVYNIWVDKLPLELTAEAPIIIGHSLGANLAIYNWSSGKKLILVNPLIPDRNFFVWLWKWLNNITLTDVSKSVRPSFYSILKAIQILKFNTENILKTIPPEDVVIIRAKKDLHFCNEEAVNYAKNFGFKVIELDTKHMWSKEYEKKINKIILDF